MPETKFDSKSFNPLAFGHYVKILPNPTRNELAKCGAVGSNEQARNALSTQTGSLYARVPYFGRISADTSQNNDGGTNITASSTTTYEQGFITASRMDAWTERSFSKNITSGVDFMKNVASQIGDYKTEVRQRMLLAILQGVFSMKTTGSTTAAKANKAFIDNHVYDISGNSGDNALVGASTLNSAITKACGDNKSIFTLVIMHSVVAARLENLKLVEFLKQTDANGIERQLSLASWNGRTVLIDDTMPVTEVAESAAGKNDGYTTYTTYILGRNSIILDNIGDSVPYEMSRDASKNGGQDTLYVRDRYIVGVDGISFEKPASITASATNDDLKNGDNWQLINDGTTAIPHKTIALAKIISRG